MLPIGQMEKVGIVPEKMEWYRKYNASIQLWPVSWLLSQAHKTTQQKYSFVFFFFPIKKQIVRTQILPDVNINE